MDKTINIIIVYQKKWMAFIEETNERLAIGETKNEAITKAMFSFERESNCKLLIKNEAGKIIKTRCRRLVGSRKLKLYKSETHSEIPTPGFQCIG